MSMLFSIVAEAFQSVDNIQYLFLAEKQYRRDCDATHAYKKSSYQSVSPRIDQWVSSLHQSFPC